MANGSFEEPVAPAKSTTTTSKKDHMHTTWHLKPSSEWTFSQKVLAKLQVFPNFQVEKPAPIRKLGDPVPVYAMRDQALDIAPYCIVPIALQYAFMRLTGFSFHPLAAYIIYTAGYNMLSLTATRKATRLAQKYGYFDGEHPRDLVPDGQTDYVLFEILKVVLLRPIIILMIAYDRHEIPSVSIFLPLKLCVWSIVTDSFF